MSARQPQQGAALLLAMITVTLVATVAATAIHRQWSRIEVEQAQRSQVQAQWLLRAAMDWSRLLLRQDAQSSSSEDHLAEPWAIPLQETKLSAFIQAQAGVTDADASSDTSQAYLSGWMQDQQAKLNLLHAFGSLDAVVESQAVARLFEQLGLPHSEYLLLRNGMRQALQTGNGQVNRPLMPQLVQDLAWLGLSAATIQRLEPYVTLQSTVTKINLNTASAEVIAAAHPSMSWGQAQALVQARGQQSFKKLADAQKVIDDLPLSDSTYSVKSDHFMASGQVRMDGLVLAMQADLERMNTYVYARSVRTMGMALAPSMER